MLFIVVSAVNQRAGRGAQHIRGVAESSPRRSRACEVAYRARSLPRLTCSCADSAPRRRNGPVLDMAGRTESSHHRVDADWS